MNENNIPNNNVNPQDTEKKKFNALPLIIIGAAVAVFVVLIVIIICVLVIFSMLTKNMSHDDHSAPSSSIPYVTKAEVTVPETTTTEPETTTTTTTTITVTTTVPVTTTTSAGISDDELTDAVTEALESFCVDFAPVRNIEYSLLDISGDNIPELFIRAEGLTGTSNYVYMYDDKKFSDVGIYGENIMISDEDMTLQVINYEGGTDYLFYQFDGDYFYLDEELLLYDGKFYLFKNEIDAEEYNKRLNAHNNKAWRNPDYTRFVNADQSFASVYAGLPNISKSPEDMQFYDGDELKYGKVTTESTELNLRSAPDTSSDIVYKLPKGDSVTIYGENSEWYYVMYSQTSPFKYGFVSKKFITVTN